MRYGFNQPTISLPFTVTYRWAEGNREIYFRARLENSLGEGGNGFGVGRMKTWSMVNRIGLVFSIQSGDSSGNRNEIFTGNNFILFTNSNKFQFCLYQCALCLAPFSMTPNVHVNGRIIQLLLVFNAYWTSKTTQPAPMNRTWNASAKGINPEIILEKNWNQAFSS